MIFRKENKHKREVSVKKQLENNDFEEVCTEKQIEYFDKIIEVIKSGQDKEDVSENIVNIEKLIHKNEVVHDKLRFIN